MKTYRQANCHQVCPVATAALADTADQVSTLSSQLVINTRSLQADPADLADLEVQAAH
jgi:cytochrome oxidase Cu insertion factor (SCO1/SenC/PrrC family)